MKNEDAQPLPHLNTSGQAHMVDITGKQPTVRQARARAFVHRRSWRLCGLAKSRKGMP